MKYDYLIVGAGLFGSVMARELTDAGKKCLVIDKRSHIAGNCYTRLEKGISVHQYGPHIFHTSDEKVWAYVNRFAKFNHFVYTPKVHYQNKLFSFPMNMMTFYQLWGVKTPDEARKKFEQIKEPISNPQNMEDWCLANIGRELYETFVRGYTKKQWGREPRLLPSFIIQRLPIRFTFDDNYFRDRFQGIPIGGYTAIFEKLLQGIDVELGVDFLPNRSLYQGRAKKTIYTGKIDEFYDYQFGELEYRTLRFEEEWRKGDFQGNAAVNYTEEAVPYTRIIEHKHFEFVNSEDTVITREYPEKWSREKTPYYPVNDERNNKIHERYQALAEKENSIVFGGRLADYKYYDMHQVVARALMMSDREKVL